MNETPSVHQRIVAVIGDMPALGKTQRNEQQKFMYRGHDDVMLDPRYATALRGFLAGCDRTA